MNYGRVGLKLELPDKWNVIVIRKKEMPVLPDPNEAMALALKQPLGSKSLADEAKGRISA